MTATKKKQVPPPVDEGLRRATIEVLRERGFSGLTLERVAEVSGRARSTLWRQSLSREVLVEALVGELAEDFRATMYPILTSAGSGLDRLTRGLEALCDLLDRHLPLMLATDEAFHQDTAPGVPPDYLHPFIQFLREGAQDGSLPEVDDVVRAADIAFNMAAWPYVHLRGRHEWPADEARSCVVAVVLRGIADPTSPRPSPGERSRHEHHGPAVSRTARAA
jgi:AcrR family transcriptional regulator